jgi:hypothetical protein
MHRYAIGNRVTHAQYGDGTVRSVDTYHTKIEFDAHGLRTFATERVVLEPSDTAAPVKAPARRKRAPRAAATPQPSA